MKHFRKKIRRYLQRRRYWKKLKSLGPIPRDEAGREEWHKRHSYLLEEVFPEEDRGPQILNIMRDALPKRERHKLQDRE